MTTTKKPSRPSREETRWLQRIAIAGAMTHTIAADNKPTFSVSGAMVPDRIAQRLVKQRWVLKVTDDSYRARTPRDGPP